MGFILIISNLERFAIVEERAESYVWRANVAGEEGRSKRLVYKDGIMADKCREVENTSSASCNKEITREKSVRKEVRWERTQKIEDGMEKLSRPDVARIEAS